MKRLIPVSLSIIIFALVLFAQADTSTAQISPLAPSVGQSPLPTLAITPAPYRDRDDF